MDNPLTVSGAEEAGQKGHYVQPQALRKHPTTCTNRRSHLRLALLIH